MDEMPQNSQVGFIPKTYNSPGANKKSATPLGLPELVAISCVFILLIAFVIVSFIETRAKNESDGLVKQISDIQNSVSRDTLSDIKNLDTQLAVAKSVIEAHRVASPILRYLENTVLPKVRYTDLTFDFKSKIPKVSINGLTDTYQNVYDQSTLLSNAGKVSHISFPDFVLDEQTGMLKFSLNFLPAESMTSFISAHEIPKTNVAPISPQGQVVNPNAVMTHDVQPASVESVTSPANSNIQVNPTASQPNSIQSANAQTKTPLPATNSAVSAH